MRKMDLAKGMLPEIYALVMLIGLTLALSACAPSALDPFNSGSHAFEASVSASESKKIPPQIQMRPDNIGDESASYEVEEGDQEDHQEEVNAEAEVKVAVEAEKSITGLKPESFKADWDVTDKGTQWTGITLKALESIGQDMIVLQEPTDVKEYCPKYKKLSYEERLQFYVMLISSMARFESGFDPKTKHTEDFKDSNGVPVVSRGLLQMSYESAVDYGCKLKNPQTLHNAEANLRCAVKILNSWVKRDKKIGSWGVKSSGKPDHLGGGRYWSVLRKTSDSRPQIQAKTLSLKFCK